MIKVDLNKGGHKWANESRSTIFGRSGSSDGYKSGYSTPEGKAHELGFIAVSGHFRKRADHCRKPEDLKIEQLNAVYRTALGIQCDILKKNSIHQMTPPPTGEVGTRDKWRMVPDGPHKLLRTQ